MTPLEQIAREVAMTPGEISKFLEPFNVDLVSENKVSRHPLRLRRIRFSGTKQSADESGPFNFDHSFSDGCTSIASDKNLTGKTSVIAIREVGVARRARQRRITERPKMARGNHCPRDRRQVAVRH